MRKARQPEPDQPSSTASASREDPLLLPKDRKGKQKATADDLPFEEPASSSSAPRRMSRDASAERQDQDQDQASDDDRASVASDDDPVDDPAPDDDLFHENLQPLHPTVVAFLAETALHDRVLPDRLRKRLLRAFPPVADFSVRAPVTDHAFASLAHPSSLRRDRQLVNLTILQLQAIRPLLLAWSELLDIQAPSQRDREIMDALRTSISLVLHSVATTTTLRRKWILNDVNPSLVRTLATPVSPLFGQAVTQRLQEADTVASTVRKLQQRPNGQRGDQRYNNNNNNRGSNRYDNNSNNRYSGRNNASGRDNRNYSSNYNQRQRYYNNSNSNNNFSDRNRTSDGRTRDSNGQVPPGNHA
jgi:hypothetical protein